MSRWGEGRKPHVSTEQSRKFVEAMAATKMTQAEIATVIGVSIPTLLKFYRHELKTAALRANATVGATWFQAATGGGKWQDANMTAMIWWTKVHMKAKEPIQEVRHSGAIGSYDITKLSDEDLDHLHAILSRTPLIGHDKRPDEGES
jgi:hypothetical protein